MTDYPRYIFDHEERAAADLVSALRRPILRAIVRAFGAQVQELEDAAYACISDRLLDVAVGAQLDAWGEVVGERRGGLDDLEYRRFIQARLIANRAQGRPDELLRVAALVAQPLVEPARYTPRYPACYTLQVVRSVGWSPEGAARVGALLASITPAGVGWGLINAPSGAFGFEDDPEALGLDEGLLADLIAFDY